MLNTQGRRILTDSSKTKKWLAYELHDRLLPWIHGARLHLSNVKTSPENQQQIEVANHCLRIASEEGRALIGLLESMEELENADLENLVRNYVQQARVLTETQQQELAIIEPFVGPAHLTAEESWAVYRIVQQAIQNAIQHAGPCQILIRSQTSGSGWKIMVSDTGIGFDTSVDKNAHHFGLISMEQRAESVGASLSLESTPGQGTHVELAINLSNRSE